MHTNPEVRTALLVPPEFAIGAIAGTILGILERDLALWLSIGIGGGIAAGAVIGAMTEFRKK